MLKFWYNGEKYYPLNEYNMLPNKDKSIVILSIPNSG